MKSVYKKIINGYQLWPIAEYVSGISHGAEALLIATLLYQFNDKWANLGTRVSKLMTDISIKIMTPEGAGKRVNLHLSLRTNLSDLNRSNPGYQGHVRWYIEEQAEDL